MQRACQTTAKAAISSNSKTEAKKMEQKNEIATQDVSPEIIHSLVINGDLSKLNAPQKVEFYNKFCQALGLNPLTQPFQILKLQGKEVLYATKTCTEQLRKLHNVSIVEISTERLDDVYTTKVKVQDSTGRTDFGIGSLNIKGMTGDNLANALMKSETKAKRRATLSICGLGILDETELETIKQDASASIMETTHTEVSEEELKAEEELFKQAEANIILCENHDQLNAIVRDAPALHNNAKFKEMVISKRTKLNKQTA